MIPKTLSLIVMIILTFLTVALMMLYPDLDNIGFSTYKIGYNYFNLENTFQIKAIIYLASMAACIAALIQTVIFKNWLPLITTLCSSVLVSLTIPYIAGIIKMNTGLISETIGIVFFTITVFTNPLSIMSTASYYVMRESYKEKVEYYKA